MMVDSPEVIESYVSSEGMSIGIDSKPSSNTVEALKQKENNGCCKITSTGSIKEAQDMVAELKMFVIFSIFNDDMMTLITDGGIKDQSACDKICAAATVKNDSTKECAPIANNSNMVLESPNFYSFKGEDIVTNCPKCSYSKRNAQVLQHRMLEDAIALSDKKIQRMLSGGEHDIELMIESIIEGYNDTWVRNQGRIPQHLEEYQCLPSDNKRTRLTEAVLSKQSSCQELDDICHENDWILPTYRVSQSDGAFQANVTVKGFDFERSCGGNPCSLPPEARESAAAQMLVNLRNVAKSAK
ncbi:double strand RNA binding domain from DEAD END PROTEIN 1 [Sesbania bispinosa]|nr:double strand RNA binding domain from DEAD END PROTEIN 1 [Sesbania bispinosa]